jgi:hypothetical protein
VTSKGKTPGRKGRLRDDWNVGGPSRTTTGDEEPKTTRAERLHYLFFRRALTQACAGGRISRWEFEEIRYFRRSSRLGSPTCCGDPPPERKI